MKVTKEDFNAFVDHARKRVPGFTVYDGKKSSYLMNLIDGVVYPFNRSFMTGYITTLAGSVYFPKGRIERDPRGALEIAGHEFVHAYDAKRLTFPLFAAMYLSFITIFLLSFLVYGIFGSWWALLPLGWALVHATAVAVSFSLRRITGFPLLLASLIAAAGMSVWSDGLGSIWLLASLVFLAPIPAPGRYWAEHRGYGGSITFEIALYGRAQVHEKVHQFTGPNYYFMMPFVAIVAKKLKSYETKALQGNVDDPAFLHVLEFIEDLKARQEGTQ